MELMNISEGRIITSNKIAELTGKEHKTVLRDIRNLIDNIEPFDAKEVGTDLFPSTYKDNSNRIQKNYALSKDGMMLLITGYSVTHRMKLIKYCGELEKKIVAPQLSEMEMISKIAANYVKQDKRIEVLEFKVKNKITLDSGQQAKIKSAVNKKVMERWTYLLMNKMAPTSNKNMNYKDRQDGEKKFKQKLFRNLYKNLYQKFGVPSYRDIKEEEYDLALSFINTWIEDSEVRNG